MIEKYPVTNETTGVTVAISNFSNEDSGQRSYMAWAQSQQAPKPQYPELPYSLTGYEQQLAETTVAITMPCNAVIEEVIPHYVKLGTRIETAKTVVYMNDDTGEFGSLDLEPYARMHDIFGVKYRLTSIGRRLHRGMSVPAGTVLAATGELEKNEGLYANSVTANLANLTLAGTAEDGLIVSEEFLERCRPTAMAKREFSCGAGSYMVNAYGDERNFKPCPGPGESIRADKVLFATRKSDEWLDGIYMLEDMINEIDFIGDDCVYAPQEAEGATVSKLTVYSAPTANRLRHTPPGMEDFLESHLSQKSEYSRKVVEMNKRLENKYGRDMRIDGSYQNLVYYALGDDPNKYLKNVSTVNGTVQFSHKNKQVDEWQIFIEIAWLFKLREGAKLTTMHGCKGVVCEIRPEADMPHDEFGNVADVVQNAKAVEDRMIWGQLYEGYYAAVKRDVAKDIVQMMADDQWEAAFEHAMRVIELEAPGQYEYFRQTKTTEEKIRKFLDNIMSTRFHVVKRADENTDVPEIAAKLRAYRAPDKSCVTYRNYDGRMIVSELPVLIAPTQMLVLDKSSFKPMAVSTARRQQHGLPSTTNKRTKVLTPTHENPGRSWAEAEGRNLTHSMGGEAVTYVLDYSANPDATKCVLRSIMANDHPFKTYKHLDRNEVPVGFNRAIQYFKNYNYCQGVEIVKTGTANYEY